ncbi:MAG: hypothetical protein R3C27_09500 [Hyphomonadaceae bacterium]
MPTRVLLAHPRGAENEARGVAAELKALGYEVQRCTPGAQRAGRHKVVMLWSRKAWGTPALRAAARQAKAAGSLLCVRLDDAPPPVRGAVTTRLAKRVAWRRLLNTRTQSAAGPTRLPRTHIQTARAKRAARPAVTPTVGTDMRIYSESSTRTFAIVLTICLFAIAGLGIAYSHYPQVAAPIDQAASTAYEQASELAALAP